jgi:hypothetical protein
MFNSEARFHCNTATSVGGQGSEFTPLFGLLVIHGEKTIIADLL